MTFFDTADGYAGGESESLLGGALVYPTWFIDRMTDEPLERALAVRPPG